MPVAAQPTVDLFVGHAEVAFGFGELLKVWVEVGQCEDDERQAKCRQYHHPQTSEDEQSHIGSLFLSGPCAVTGISLA